MRGLVLTAGAILVAVVAVFRLADPGAAARRPEPPPTAAAQPAVDHVADGTAVPVRDLFRYLEASPSAARRPEAAVDADASKEGPEEARPPVRLVGLVRRGGQLRAALSVMGELLVVGPGDPAGAYTVISLDEEAGAVLRGADGALLTLPVPEL